MDVDMAVCAGLYVRGNRVIPFEWQLDDGKVAKGAEVEGECEGRGEDRPVPNETVLLHQWLLNGE